jgi:hypothetical protein
MERNVRECVEVVASFNQIPFPTHIHSVIEYESMVMLIDKLLIHLIGILSCKRQEHMVERCSTGLTDMKEVDAVIVTGYVIVTQFLTLDFFEGVQPRNQTSLQATEHSLHS